jgi:hypothetical protein
VNLYLYLIKHNDRKTREGMVVEFHTFITSTADKSL